MKQSRKEFIKRAHDMACDDWKEEIEKEFPKLFPEIRLEVGRWYKSSRHKLMLICPTSINEDGILHGFGFNYEGKYITENNYLDGSCLCNNTASRDLIQATHQEIKEALTKEAKKRGFKEGVTHTITNGIGNIISSSDVFGFDEIDNKLIYNNWSIFQKGEWAKPIETITKEEAEKQLGKIISVD
ncbi:MAG: hypothetical protein GY928_02285 [Colwellia sp.]|nr:hypothetical protein [Colwellia sp.]